MVGRARTIAGVLILCGLALGLMGSALSPRGPSLNLVPILSAGMIPMVNSTGTAVTIAAFRCRLPASFPTGLILGVNAAADGTAVGACQLVCATTGAVVATAAVPNGTATTYESAVVAGPGGELDYILRFRINSGSGTLFVYSAWLREP